MTIEQPTTSGETDENKKVVDLATVRRERANQKELERRRPHGGRDPLLEARHNEQKTAVQETLVALKKHVDEKIHAIVSTNSGDTFSTDEQNALKEIVIDFARNAEYFINQSFVVNPIDQVALEEALEGIKQKLQAAPVSGGQPAEMPREQVLSQMYEAVDEIHKNVSGAVVNAIV